MVAVAVSWRCGFAGRLWTMAGRGSEASPPPKQPSGPRSDPSISHRHRESARRQYRHEVSSPHPRLGLRNNSDLDMGKRFSTGIDTNQYPIRANRRSGTANSLTAPPLPRTPRQNDRDSRPCRNVKGRPHPEANDLQHQQPHRQAHEDRRHRRRSSWLRCATPHMAELVRAPPLTRAKAKSS